MGEYDYWNDVAAGWQQDRDRLWRQHADAVNLWLCRRWLASGHEGRLLKTDLFDEAAGEGLWPTLVRLAGRVDAVDASLGMATMARRRHPGLSGTVADVRHLPFADASFATVVSNSTLDHFDHRESIGASFRELYRVLVPSGRLVLTLDNGANPVVALRNRLSPDWLVRLGLVPYRMGKTLGPTDARRLLQSVGFRVLDVTAILHCPRIVAVRAAAAVERHLGGPESRARLLRWLAAFEAAERWPTRFRTGYFVALLAERPS